MQLKKNMKVNVKITDVRYKKEYNGTHYFLVDIQDASGSKETVEYKSRNKEIHGVFITGIYQYILVKYDDPQVVIEPCEAPDEETLAAPYEPNKSYAAPSQASIQKSDSNLNVGGASVTFSMAYAKDLKLAEIARQPEGYCVSEQDIQDVIQWAKLLNVGLCDMAKK